MNAPIVADGRIRFEQANAEKFNLRRAQIRLEVESHYAAVMKSSGIFGRWWIRIKIRKEVAVLLRAEFPSAHALFSRQ